MSNLILNPFTPIPKSNKSHVRGWSTIWAQRLNAHIDDGSQDYSIYKNIYIEHGVNFSGSLNLFGGFNDGVYNRCLKLIEAFNQGSELYSLDWDISECKYIDQIAKRFGSDSSSKNLDYDFLEQFEAALNSCETVDMSTIDLPNIIIGDSHSLAYSLPDQRVRKMNGQTLHSALKQGLFEFISEQLSFGMNKVVPEEIDLCLGSIDIRFHALRVSDESPKKFATRYASEVIKAQNKLKTPINVCAPVPVEYEGRRIPKTGCYKGQPFYGTRQQRLDYTAWFIEELDMYWEDFNLVMPPDEWYLMDGEEYAKQIMEMGSSVHISPENYRSRIGFQGDDLRNNEFGKK